MREITNIIRIGLAVALTTLVAGALSAAARSQHKNFTIGRKGEVHFDAPVRVGNTVLKPGMYQVQHVLVGGEDVVTVNDHAVEFKEVRMPAGYRHSNNPVSKKAAARVQCLVEPTAKEVRNTTITLRTNGAGQKELAELQIAGEPFKHAFFERTRRAVARCLFAARRENYDDEP